MQIVVFRSRLLGVAVPEIPFDAVERVAEGSSVAGTVWHAPLHPETFMVEGALIRRADVGFDV